MTLCECGCGKPVAKAGNRFIVGHSGTRARPPEEHFWPKVMVAGDCWLWTGCIMPNGYGGFAVRRRKQLAHRFAYELLVGPIPDDLQLDHLCRVRNCVNPAHLEPVTPQENTRRGYWSTKDHCRNGHLYTTESMTVEDGYRRCLICRRERDRQRYAARSCLPATEK